MQNSSSSTHLYSSDSTQRQELLERAKEHVFCSIAPSDGATKLASANVVYGVAKMQAVQEMLGYPPDAMFIAGPDFSTPRYTTRWQWGSAIGGFFAWGDGSRPLIFLDLQVSTSTALVGTLSRSPERATVLERIQKLKQDPPSISGIPIEWDFDRGNHFINVYRYSKDTRGGSYVVIVHGGDSEVKGVSAIGMGLDYEKSKPLQAKMKVLETPLGAVRILLDDAAREYYATYLRCEEYAKAKRIAVAERVFEDLDTVLSNEIHHGFDHINMALMGCYRFSPSAIKPLLYPVTLRAELPAYLLQGKPSLNRNLISQEVPQSLRVQLEEANLLPHGGGYFYPAVMDVSQVVETAGHRYFILSGDGGSERVTENLSTLPYSYRGLEIMECINRWQLGDVKVELEPVMSITV